MFKTYANGDLDSIDMPVVNYEPRFQVVNPFGRSAIDKVGGRITFKQLASHMSGLQRDVPCAPQCNITFERALQWLGSNVLIKAPNEKPSYSNLGYSLLGHLISDSVLEKTKGLYPMMIEKLIFDPLNMTQSGFSPSQEDFANFAIGYVNGTITPWIDLGFLNPTGGLFVFISTIQQSIGDTLSYHSNLPGSPLQAI